MRFAAITNTFHKYNHRKKPTTVKILEFSLFFAISLFFIGVIYQFIATEMDKSSFKLKGKMVSVGGYRLLTNIVGDGKYTIVFDGDIGAPTQQWNTVKSELSEKYRVFTYERNGYGRSDSSGEEVNVSKAVSDLRKALSRSGVSSPYILVGHGYGGLIMTEYARKYSHEVVGVVLLDSMLEENIKTEEFEKDLGGKLRKYSAARFFSYMGAIRLTHSLNLLEDKEAFLKNFTENEKKLFESQKVASKYYAAFYNELKSLKEYKGNIQQEGALGDIFVEVLAITNKYEEPQKEKLYEEQQKKLKNLSTKGEFMVVERSGTYIHVDRPDAIINTINKIVKKAGKL